jgi:vitamin B12/bleomycin/antimicrobial peptide transport system ATP-binding/permease protein
MNTKAANSADTLSTGEFVRRVVMLVGGYWMHDHKWRARLLTLAIVGLTIAQVFVPILTNLWNKQLFDALESRSMDRFLLMLGLSGGIILYNIVVTVSHLWVKRKLQLGWRRWITVKVVGLWLSHGRHHQITYLPGDHDNPDGRIAEDIRIITEYAVDLGTSLFYCVLLLGSFVSILWALSGAPEVTVAGTTFAVPGYLIYIAILYAGAGTTIAMLIGKPMVRAANTRQGREADFRFGLAGVRENAQDIALLHGEPGERHRLFGLFRHVRDAWNGQTLAISYWMVFGAAYSVLSMAFPLLVVSPRYISGAITLGMLMQTAQAFQQTAAALSWPVDSLARVAEWKASAGRVLNLVDAVHRCREELGHSAQSRVVVGHSSEDDGMHFRKVSITDPDETPLIAPFDLDIEAGDRVLIGGDASAATTLFRAVARVWPWGSGRILLPQQQHVFFMPERPYLPRATLRSVLGYPLLPSKIAPGAAAAALERVGLGHLVDELDVERRWDEKLAISDQQRLGFARLFVREPDWIFIQNATDNLNREGVEDMLRVLHESFPGATVLTIGSHSILDNHHTRKVLLERIDGVVHLRETHRLHKGPDPVLERVAS